MILDSVVEPGEWQSLSVAIAAGGFGFRLGRYELDAGGWSAEGLLCRSGTTPAHEVVAGARRPVWGRSATLAEVKVPFSRDTWELDVQPGMSPGRDLGEMSRWRRQLHWPRALLGIDWLGSTDLKPPPAFVVGRTQHRAWIIDAVPDYENEEVGITIGWHADAVDPLGLTVMVRSETQGLVHLARQLRVSELPPRDQQASDAEPRLVHWRRRSLTIALPRGPRLTEWGVSLIGPDGRLVDERLVARRVEQVSVSITIDGRTQEDQVRTGDRRPTPSAQERDAASRRAVELETLARRAAADTRFSTVGELESYLRWRLSGREGELLILDPFLLGKDAQPTLAFLVRLDRHIRALTAKWSQPAQAAADATGRVDVRRLSSGSSTLHDRFWLLEDIGLHVGGSVNTFLPKLN